MGGECDAFFRDFAERRQRENLEAAAVGQNGAGPVHKAVQTAEGSDNVFAGAEVQVIGVGQLDLTADLFQIFGGQTALDGGLRADVHKDGGFHRPVGAGEAAAARAAVCLQQFKQGKMPPKKGIHSECARGTMKIISYRAPGVKSGRVGF